MTTRQNANRTGLIALAIGSYFGLCGNLSNCDDPMDATIVCHNVSIVMQPGTCQTISNPCDPGTWVASPRIDGFQLCNEPSGVTVRTRRNPTLTRELCVSASAPAFVNRQVDYYYGVGARFGLGSIQLTTVAPLTVAVSATPTTINVGDTSQLLASPSGGVAPYFYTWVPNTGLDSTNIAAPTASPAATTQYTVTVRDSASQQVSASITINVIAELEVTADPPVIDASQISQLLANATGGTPPYSYSWVPAATLNDPIASAPIATPAQTTTYSVTVTDSVGAILHGSATVRVNMAATASANPSSVNSGGQSQLAVTVVGGLPPYTYAWTPAATLDNAGSATPIATPTAPTTYTVTITDFEGFSTAAAVTVNVTTPPPAPPTASFTYTIGAGPTLNLNASASTGSIVSYTWELSWTGTSPDRITTSATTSFSVRETDFGTITLTVTDSAGQTATVSHPF